MDTNVEHGRQGRSELLLLAFREVRAHHGCREFHKKFHSHSQLALSQFAFHRGASQLKHSAYFKLESENKQETTCSTLFHSYALHGHLSSSFTFQQLSHIVINKPYERSKLTRSINSIVFRNNHPLWYHHFRCLLGIWLVSGPRCAAHRSTFPTDSFPTEIGSSIQQDRLAYLHSTCKVESN